MAPEQRQWWKEAIVYQVYPFSFKDTSGNGIGDLNGIRSKLPYLRDLGVDVVWMSPIYATPMKDCGYDISDYRAINPDLGTIDDYSELVKAAHELGLKVVMDLVVNHTSDQHEWFKNSKVGGDKKDWYIWRPAKVDENGQRHEPNNWGASFGGSCWDWDEGRQEYYFHQFDPSQPDLNWENPVVRAGVWDIMNFWLEKGCDGFRMDVINCISKDSSFADVPVTDPDAKFQGGVESRFNGPKVPVYLKEMYDTVLAPRQPDIFTVGEMPGIATPEQAIIHTKHGQPLQMIFHFEHVGVDHEPGKTHFVYHPWKLPELKRILGGFMSYNQDNDGWDSLYLENHDQPRIVSRFGNEGELRAQAAKMLALFHVTGRGTVFIYQGQEIGMANAQDWEFDELRDVSEINYYNALQKTRGPGADMTDALKEIRRIGRDNARMPVSWDNSTNAGFTSGKPWIKVNADYKEWNVAAQEGKKDSVLEFWKKVVALRKRELTLTYGRVKLLDEPSEDVYAFTRTGDDKAFTIVCSFKDHDVEWQCPEEPGSLIISNYEKTEHEPSTDMRLKPFEARIYQKQA